MFSSFVFRKSSKLSTPIPIKNRNSSELRFFVLDPAVSPCLSQVGSVLGQVSSVLGQVGPAPPSPSGS